MEPKIIDKHAAYLNVHYRAVHLRLDPTQKAVVERFFGAVRSITNHLLLRMKHYNEEQARAKSYSVRDLEVEVLKFMEQSELPLFKEGLITPSILRGILVAWVSEWEDFRHHRISRPSFRQHQGPQKFYIIDSAVEYTENNIKMHHCPEFDLHLRSSKFPISNKAPVHLLKRTEDGEYWLYTLHESTTYTPVNHPDEVLGAWCEKILDLERELKSGRRRYLSTSGSRRSEQNYGVENQLMTLRKITLDRLLRAREARIVNHKAQATLQHSEAA